MEQPIEIWESASGSDGSKGYDGDKEYALADRGYIFWEDWLGRLYSWMPPKLQWTRDDYYNFEDLDRVENNTKIITGLVGYFVNLPPLSFVINRDLKRIEFADSLNRIESNQETLRQRYTPEGWQPNKTDWEANSRFSFHDALRLEYNLNLLYQHYKGNTEIVPICGAFICGEEVI